MDAISRAYGRAFGVEPWAYEVFAEEVIRGGPAFAVSLVITAIEPTLRNAAALGAWQVRGVAVGVGGFGWGGCLARRGGWAWGTLGAGWHNVLGGRRVPGGCGGGRGGVSATWA